LRTRLEDEAFGPPQRPDQADPFAEAPTEFLLAPDDAVADAPEIADEDARGGRRPNITDLQEPPPADAPPAPGPADPGALPPPEDELSPAPDAPPPSPTDAAEVPLPPPPEEAPAPPAPEDVGPSTEERHAIADQPTQMFDVQAHVDAEEATAGPAEQASPTDEELVDAAQAEPHAAPPAPEEPILPEDAGTPTEIHEQPALDLRGPDAEVAGHPPAEAAPEEDSAEFDFFNEQRLADELDQALEAPITDERTLPGYEDSSGQSNVFDYEEDPSEEVLRRMDEPPSEEAPRNVEPPSEEVEQPSEEFEPPSEETEQPSEEFEAPSEEYEQPSEEFEAPSEEAPRAATEPPSEESAIDYDPDTGHEDVLEDTPRFLEDAPEDDDLWFEQKPPKDFDLD
jgi:hypothetical protein